MNLSVKSNQFVTPEILDPNNKSSGLHDTSNSTERQLNEVESSTLILLENVVYNTSTEKIKIWLDSFGKVSNDDFSNYFC